MKTKEVIKYFLPKIIFLLHPLSKGVAPLCIASLDEDEKERKGWTESWAGPGRRLMRCPEMERYMTTLPTSQQQPPTPGTGCYNVMIIL